MDSAVDLLRRLSDLKKDIYESTRCITTMLETIEEEKAIYGTQCSSNDFNRKTTKFELKRKQELEEGEQHNGKKRRHGS